MLQTRVNIGRRDKLIYIMRPVIAIESHRPSTNEDKITAWVKHSQHWAWVRGFKGNEAMIAEKLTEGHYVVANIRTESGITTLMRMWVEGRVYEIASLPPSEDRRTMDIVGNLLDNETWTPT